MDSMLQANRVAVLLVRLRGFIRQARRHPLKTVCLILWAATIWALPRPREVFQWLVEKHYGDSFFQALRNVHMPSLDGLAHFQHWGAIWYALNVTGFLSLLGFLLWQMWRESQPGAPNVSPTGSVPALAIHQPPVVDPSGAIWDKLGEFLNEAAALVELLLTATPVPLIGGVPESLGARGWASKVSSYLSLVAPQEMKNFTAGQPASSVLEFMQRSITQLTDIRGRIIH